MLLSRKPGYVLRLEPDELDSWRLEAGVVEAKEALARGEPGFARERASAALDLWRGPPLVEVASADFAQPEINRLEELQAEAVETVLEARLALGHHVELVGELQALVAAHPLRERLWGFRVLALYRAGRQADALRSYQELRQLLTEGLGIEPSPAMQELESAILRQDSALDWKASIGGGRLSGPATPEGSPGQLEAADAGPSRRPHARPHTIALGSFLGRDKDLGEIASLLRTVRLVTLTGVSGVGKTRLALETATTPAAGIVDEVGIVYLAALREPDLVAEAVAAQLRVAQSPRDSPLEAVIAHLRHRRVLLVLDNAEHVVGAVASLAEAILHDCPQVSVIVTSQEPLRIEGERVFPLAPLALPDPARSPSVPEEASPAVRLFFDRAVAVRPDFQMTVEVTPVVAEICRRLDGVPLAIELAAARVSVLSPRQIASRLDQRFQLLTGGKRTVLPRHHSLQQALDWTYQLLSDAEGILLRRLSVFAGGCSLDAIEHICAGEEIDSTELLDTLAGLVAKSLVVADTMVSEARYRLLETIRHYAAERLAETDDGDAVRARHASWYLVFAEQADADLTGSAQPAALDRFDDDYDNLRVALSWAHRERAGEIACRLAGALSLFWRLRGYFGEGRQWLGMALTDSGQVGSEARSKALWGLGFLALMVEEWEQAVVALEESLELYRVAGDQSGAARSLMLLGNRWIFEDRRRAIELLEQSAALARTTGDSWCLGHSLGLTGLAQRSSPEVAAPFLEECIAVARTARDAQSLRLGLNVLGRLRVDQGRYDLAEPILREALGVARELDETYAMAVAANSLGDLSIGIGDWAQASELLEECLGWERGSGNRTTLAHTLSSLGRLALIEGDLSTARSRFSEALQAMKDCGETFSPAMLGLAEVALSAGDLVEARALLSDALAVTNSGAASRGKAQILHSLGNLERAAGDLERADEQYMAALALRQKVEDGPGMTASLEAIGGLEAVTGHAEGGALLLAAAQAARDRRGWARSRVDVPHYESDLARARAALAPVDVDSTWQSGRHLSLREAADFAARTREIGFKSSAG